MGKEVWSEDEEMTFSLSLAIKSLILAVIVGLVCILIGSILSTLQVPILVTIGGFLTQWGWVLGVLAGLWYYFSGGSSSL